VIVYRAVTLPIHKPRIERWPLGELAKADIELQDTVVIPPAAALEPDPETRARLAALDLSLCVQSAQI
jgi:hypothetical protein